MAQNDIQVKVRVDSDVEKQLKKDQAIVQSTTNKMSKGFGGLTSAVKGVALPLAGAAAGVYAIKKAFDATIVSAAKFEKGMKEVSTLVDTQRVDMKKLSLQVMGLSSAYGENTGGLTKALYQTISAGVDAEKAISFLDVATKAAIGGVTDTATAVDGLTSILNAYGWEAGRAEEASDILFTTVKKGKTTLAELSPVIGQVAPLASAAGVSMQEMSSALAAMTLSGLQTTEAGTALRGLLNSLLKPTDDAKEAAEELGIAWGIQGLQAHAGGLKGFLEDVQKATGGNAETLSRLVPEVRGLNAVLQLTGNQADAFAQTLTDMETAAGATTEAAEKMKDSLTFEWNKFIANVSNAAMAIGSVLIPAIKSAVKWMNELMGAPDTENASSKRVKDLREELKGYEAELKTAIALSRSAGLGNAAGAEEARKTIGGLRASIRMVKEELGTLETEIAKVEKIAPKEPEKADKKDKKKLVPVMFQMPEGFREQLISEVKDMNSDLQAQEEKRLELQRINAEKSVRIKIDEQKRIKQAEDRAVINSMSAIRILAGINKDASKENFAVYKAASFGEATVAGALAITKAWASAPFPANLPGVALVGAGTAANIARISAMQPPKFQHGGIVGGDSFAGDRMTARVNSGEMILNRQQQTSLFNAINRGTAGASISVGGDTFVINGDADESFVQGIAKTKESRLAKLKNDIAELSAAGQIQWT